MKTHAFGVLLLLVFTGLLRAEKKPLHLFLLVGQSNMAGRAPMEAEDKKPIEGASLWHIAETKWVPAQAPFNLYSPHRKDAKMQRLNPGPGFVRAYQKAHPNVRVGIVCAARGGTSIRLWERGQQLYDSAVIATRDAIASDPKAELKGILWHQGESDSGASKSYPEKLELLVSSFREDLGREVPFVFSQVGQWKEGYFAFNQMILTMPGKIQRSSCVTTEDLTAFDSAHFDTASQRILGLRFAQKLLGIE